MGSEHLPGTESPPGKQKTTWRRPGIPRIGAPACVLGGRPDLWAGTERCHTSDRMFTSPSSPDGSAAGRPPAAGPGREPQSSVSREARRPDGPRRRRAAPCSSRPRPQWRPRPAPPSARPQTRPRPLPALKSSPQAPRWAVPVRTKRGGPRDVVSETASAGVRTQPRGTQGPGDSWRAGVGGGGGFSHCSRSDSESTRGP